MLGNVCPCVLSVELRSSRVCFAVVCLSGSEGARNYAMERGHTIAVSLAGKVRPFIVACRDVKELCTILSSCCAMLGRG